MRMSPKHLLKVFAVVLVVIFLIMAFWGVGFKELEDLNTSKPSFGVESQPIEIFEAAVSIVESVVVEDEADPPTTEEFYEYEADTPTTEEFYESEYEPETEEVVEDTWFDDENDIYEVPDEVYLIAQTLAGECYEDKINDKISVAEVIVNRVSVGGFGNDIYEVVTAPGQFDGYWTQSRPITDNDLWVAREVLTRWEENNYSSLSPYLYFHAGPGEENIFREGF